MSELIQGDNNQPGTSWNSNSFVLNPLNPMASHNHQPPECEWCEGWCGHLIPDDKCEQCESRRPTYTASQVQEMKNAWVEEIAGLFKAKRKVMATTRRNRVALGNDTIVQDCKIDILDYVLAKIKEMKE